VLKFIGYLITSAHMAIARGIQLSDAMRRQRLLLGFANHKIPRKPREPKGRIYPKERKTIPQMPILSSTDNEAIPLSCSSRGVVLDSRSRCPSRDDERVVPSCGYSDMVEEDSN